MTAEDAVRFVQENIGEAVMLCQLSENEYCAIAYRDNHWGGDSKAYSTHMVYPRGCESGHYDMSFKQAVEDYNKRCGL